VAFVLQADHLAPTRAAAIHRLAQCGRDLVIIDYSYDGSDEQRWSPDDIRLVREKRENRKVVAYLSIGEAENFRWYWRANWDRDGDGKPDADAPRFLDTVNPDWKGSYKVRYWQADWQSLVLTNLAIIAQQGFDGVYLDAVDAFEYYESKTAAKRPRESVINPETGNTYRDDMLFWIRRLAEEARKGQTGFLIIPQNGEALLAQPAYGALIDAMGVEELFTSGKIVRRAESVKSRLDFLAPMRAARKPVIAIEYASNKKALESAMAQAQRNAFILLVTDRPLTSFGHTYPPEGSAATKQRVAGAK
jgi:cysteinyl-tRNA synthetase